MTETHEVASLVEQIVEQLGLHIDRLPNSLQARLDEHVHENQSAIRKRIDARADKIAQDLGRRLDGQAHDLRQILKRVLGPLAVQITETITKQGNEHWLVLKKEMKEASSTTARRAAQRPIIDKLLALLDRIRSEGAFLNAWYRRDPDLALHLGCRQLHERYDGAVASFAKEILMVLRGLGVEQIEGCAGPFNPKLQHVVKVEMTSKSELDGHVAWIVRAGFTWNGTVLRPEQVVVHKKQERKNHEEKK